MIGILSLTAQRPVVAYDPANKQHRKYLAEYLRTHSWAKCPYRFVSVDHTGVDHLVSMTNATLSYYISKEFARSGPK